MFKHVFEHRKRMVVHQVNQKRIHRGYIGYLVIRTAIMKVAATHWVEPGQITVVRKVNRNRIHRVYKYLAIRTAIIQTGVASARRVRVISP